LELDTMNSEIAHLSYIVFFVVSIVIKTTYKIRNS